LVFRRGRKREKRGGGGIGDSNSGPAFSIPKIVYKKKRGGGVKRGGLKLPLPSRGRGGEKEKNGRRKENEEGLRHTTSRLVEKKGGPPRKEKKKRGKGKSLNAGAENGRTRNPHQPQGKREEYP